MTAKTHLFISYRSIEAEPALKLGSDLNNEGFEVWMDRKKGLQVADDWREKIQIAIDSCAAMIAMVSPEYVASKMCKRELARADELDRIIFPIVIKAVSRDTWPIEIQRVQYLDFEGWRDQALYSSLLQQLISALRERLSSELVAVPTGPTPVAIPQVLEIVEAQVTEIATTAKTPLRIVAGPGTGKTSALMLRISDLLTKGTDPAGIFLVTFTRMAANELAKALAQSVGANAELIKKGTLHSYCFSILKQAAYFLQTGRVARTLNEFEKRFMLEDLAHEKTFGTFRDCEKLLFAFEAAWAREQHQDAGWAMKEIDKNFQQRLIDWLRFHQSMLVEEIVPKTLEFLRSNPDNEEFERFSHILVDEYQDLNKAEQSLIDLINHNNSLTIAGDEDQSIYSFKHAHPEGIREFAQTHQNTWSIPLSLCQRCPTLVVEAANNLIVHNRSREIRQLQGKPTNPIGEIQIVRWNTIQDEATGLAEYITRKVGDGSFLPGQILVLCPRREFGLALQRELQSRNQAAHSFFSEGILHGNPRSLDRSTAQQAFTLFALAINPNNRVALRCWLGFGHKTLRAKQYKALREYCEQNGSSPREVLDSILEGSLPRTLLGQEDLLTRYELLVEQLRLLNGLEGQTLFDSVFPSSEEWAIPFHRIVETLPEDSSAKYLLETLKTNISQPEMPTDVDYIRIMSLHKSKGLTADHVIVTGFIEGLIPTHPDPEDPDEQQERFREEQRRLFYVAITRPKKTLILSSVGELSYRDATRMRARIARVSGQVVRTITSTFASELGPKCGRAVLGSEWLTHI